MNEHNTAAYRLVLLRHGQSEWNARNLFTGWANPDLTAAGEREAVRAGHLLAARRLRPDYVHTSLQRRAIHSAELALAACDRDWIPVRRSWRLKVKHLDAIGDDAIATVNIPNGTPLVYHLGPDMQPVTRDCYLEPEPAGTATRAG